MACDLTTILGNLLDNAITYCLWKIKRKNIKYKNNHGLGIKSIQNILEKYDGEMRINYNSDTFSTSVIIPY